MDNNSSVPSFELPKSAEQDPGSAHDAERDGIKPESNKEMLPPPVQSMPMMSPQAGSGPASGVVAQVSSTVGDDAHLIADDNDVIEKEWVDRAKKIVAATSHDPYVESKELSKLKATYMKKRFNKDVPLAGEAGQ